VTIDLSSFGFDTFLGLLNSSNSCIASDNNRGPGTNSRLIMENLSTGTYFIEVSTVSTGAAGGSYTLSLQPGFPPAIPINLGDTVSGNLSSIAAEGICNFAPTDRYTFTLASPTTITIDLSSSAFDTFLGLLNSSNDCFASDNNSGGGTNSRLIRNLSAGTYFIEVTTVSPSDAGGPYTLSLN
jgi:tyrosinase